MRCASGVFSVDHHDAEPYDELRLEDRLIYCYLLDKQNHGTFATLDDIIKDLPSARTKKGVIEQIHMPKDMVKDARPNFMLASPPRCKLTASSRRTVQ